VRQWFGLSQYRNTQRLWGAVVLTLFSSLGATGATAAGLTGQEQVGRQIYRTGQSPAGSIEALVGNQQIRLDAASFPCASCHGREGGGRAESSVVPSDIRWSRLTRSYGGQAPSGRRFPAYDEATLARAITEGVDPAGNRLDPAMPRFRLAEDDLAALVAYLKRLEEDRDPGITDAQVTFATVIPANGSQAAAGEAVAALLQARFDDLNGRGGLYGRRLELVVRRAEDREQARQHFEALMKGDEAFALISPFTEGMDAEVAALAEDQGVPVLAPVTRRPPADAGGRKFSFYLFAGPDVQVRALVDFALPRLEPSAPVVVVHDGDASLAPVVEAAAARVRHHSGSRRVSISALEAGPEAIEALAADDTAAVFFLGDGAALQRWLAQAVAADWSPEVYALGGLVGRDALQAPEQFQDRLYLAFPSSAGDVEPQAWADFTAFHRRHELPNGGLAPQSSAYAATDLLVAALRDGGRELSREGLVAGLGSLYAHTTGLTPPLTYTGSRRIGARGAHIVGVDLEGRRLLADPQWVETR
jgi:ABC-type branched-subunit amino acid transport system substrate-binding protein